MASISQSSVTGGVYAKMSAANKGIGGLVSGLDTDQLVEAMLTNTRSKLNKQLQNKTRLEWKTTAYRNVTSLLSEFQNKYYTYSNSSSKNMLSNAFFNTFKSTTSSNKVSVNPTTSASSGNIEIAAINQLAEPQSLTQIEKFTADLVTSPITFPTTGYADTPMKLTVGNVTKTIKLDTLDGINNITDFKNELQDLLNDSFGTYSTNTTKPYIEVMVVGNTLKFDAGTNGITVVNDVDGLGFSAGDSNRVSTGTAIKDLPQFAGIATDTFSFTINGKTITANVNESLSTIMSRVNNSGAAVKMSYNSYTDKFTIEATESGTGDTLEMKDVQGNFMALMFGAAGGDRLTSTTQYDKAYFEGDDLTLFAATDYDTLHNSSLKLTIGNSTKTITLNLSDYKDDIDGGFVDINDALISALNKAVDDQFGTGSGVSFAWDNTGGTDNIVLQSSKNQYVAMEQSTSTAGYDLMDQLGFDSSDKYQNQELSGVWAYNNQIIGDMASTSPKLIYDTMHSMRYAAFAVEVTDDQGTTTRYSIGLYLTEDQKQAYAKCTTDTAKMQYLASVINSEVKAQTGGLVNVGLTSNGTFGFSITGGNYKVAISQATAADHTDIETANPGLAGYTSQDLYGMMFDIPTNGTSVNNVVTSPDRNITLGDLATTSDVSPSNYNFTITLGDPLIPTNTFDASAFGFDENTSLLTMVNTINSHFGTELLKFNGNQIVLNADGEDLSVNDMGTGVLTGLFGLRSNTYQTSSEKYYTQEMEDANDPTTGYTAKITKGKNAEIMMADGTTIFYSSNTITIDGVEVTLEALHNAGKGIDDILAGVNNMETITIRTVYDSDEMVEKIQEWIDDYNAIIDTLYGIVKEEKEKGYDPLTDEQRAELTDDQIEKWEKEAKKGLLRNDSTINSILNNLRGCLYNTVDSVGMALYSVGITTMSMSSSGNGSTNLVSGGKLEITDDGMKLLKNALETDPSAVAQIFTDAEQGVSHQLNNALDAAVKVSADETQCGSLVRLAATDGSSGYIKYYLKSEITRIEETIARLTSRLENEYNRYWKKFSNLETTLSRLSSQSSVFDSI